ncbi:ankyrin repeat domain-containing protein [Legionella yabuuchiae]|uniref:ankyrin repeat domain-containing protein n=1 Tax=Legionella yabuuchiae TaxID=376727 RepID=UPI001055C246|nr:ankyrin repeat domain-containing protein [Legionella yabuuchiae]
MPTPTEHLKELLTKGTTSHDFKQSAMTLARQGADITVRSRAGSEPTLLHILVHQNENGANNNEIAELVGLNAEVLTAKDYNNKTAWQSLLDAFTNQKCSFDKFKQSAMTLARQGADITVRSRAGSEPTLLHILVHQNENGANNNEIAELVGLNAEVLTAKDYNNKTAWQSLLDAFTNQKCSFDKFKQTAMALARLGADITARGRAGSEPTLLHILIHHNENGANNNEIAELVDLNAAVLTTKDYYNRTAWQSLLDAFTNQLCSFDKFKQTAMALARLGADITARGRAGSEPTLLHILIHHNENGANNNEIAELVGLNAAVLTTKDYYNRTAWQSLLDAFTNQQCSFDKFKQTAMALARLGADITARGRAGSEPTLLHILVHQNENGANNNEIAELVGLNAEVLTAKDYNNKTAWQSLLDAFTNQQCSFDKFKQTAMALAKLGVDITARGRAGSEPTLLHVLAHHNEEGVNNRDIADLVSLNAAVLESKDYYGRTPIHFLLWKNHNVTIEAIEKLLSEANLHLVDNQDATLLHAACHSGNLPVVEYFITKGLSLTALTNRDETLIHYAVSSGNVGLIQWLIDTKKIDINAQDKSGETALHCATRKNKREVIELLTCNGADLTIKNNEGQRAYEIATRMKYNDLVPYLFNPKEEFFHKIKAMHKYGELLKDQGVSKGQVAIDLASNLTIMAEEFFQQTPEQRNFAEFELRFSALLHSKDKEMSAYRISWGTIVANIAIALTGVGLLFIAGKLIHSKVTENRALFFFQKSKTTSEEKIADVEHAASLIAQSA